MVPHRSSGGVIFRNVQTPDNGFSRGSNLLGLLNSFVALRAVHFVLNVIMQVPDLGRMEAVPRKVASSMQKEPQT
jgi:hypothetical protein